MTIPWLYLDKERAAVNALKDHAAMEHIIANYADDLTESKDFLTSVPSPLYTASYYSAAKNIRSAETRMASGIDRIDVIEERYRKAVEYMAWFSPAWQALSGDEQQLLQDFYLADTLVRGEIVKRLCEEKHCEKSSVYRLKDKALEHLALLLYGK